MRILLRLEECSCGVNSLERNPVPWLFFPLRGHSFLGLHFQLLEKPDSYPLAKG